jgi:cation:H+ antiporter
VGSNVANIGIVLGATALVRPFRVTSRELFRRDMPILSVTTVLAVVFFLSGEVGRTEGLILVAIAVGFTVLSLRRGGDEVSEGDERDEASADALDPWGKAAVLVLVGVAGLVIGAHFMVEGGTFVARTFGISERVIGLTIVAVGTSLPELAASIAGALKGHPGLAVGNVVGSCLFNLTFVLGASATIAPLPANADAMIWDLAAMGGLTLLMWMVLGTGRRLTRKEGASLVGIYVGYLCYLVITTMQGTAG